jgi:hypothetical protein
MNSFTADLDHPGPAGPGVLDAALAQAGIEQATVLTEHHQDTPAGPVSWYVLHDGTAVWRPMPGPAQLASLRIGNGRLTGSRHTLLATAQGWLIQHGCPAHAAVRAGEGQMSPADPATEAITSRLREDYPHLDEHDSYAAQGPEESWVILHDTTAPALPVRAVTETTDPATFTSTLREAAFATVDEARAWIRDNDGPTPATPTATGARQHLTTAARAHSPHAHPTQTTATPPGETRPPTPPPPGPGPHHR